MSVETITSDFVNGLDRIVQPGSLPEQILSGFEFLEGPAWHPATRMLVFSDIIGDTLYRWDENNGVSKLRAPSHMANGNAWDEEGRLLTCEHATSRVSRGDSSGRYEVLASHYQGRELNSPNDIVVKRDGSIYFTDPNSGRGSRFGVARPQELEFQGVFRIDPLTFDLTLLIDDFSKPNGLCLSLDESVLFINDTDKQHIRVFDVMRDGSIENGRIWAETGGKEPGVADGMKIDSGGNLYCCGSGGIHVFDAGGDRIGIIGTPEFATNFTWGGTNLTELYITATHSIYRLRTKVPGHDPLAPISSAA
jgi:gluconolactonase